MRTFIIINGGTVRLIQAESSKKAYHSAINYCNHSKEIILREVTGFHNCTDKHIRTRNVTSFK